VPLMLSHGTGSELRQPLGYTMFGGLIVSQALTLFTTPIIYLYLDQLAHWISGGAREKAPSMAKMHERQPELPLDLADAKKKSSREPEWVEGRAPAE